MKNISFATYLLTPSAVNVLTSQTATSVRVLAGAGPVDYAMRNKHALKIQQYLVAAG